MHNKYDDILIISRKEYFSIKFLVCPVLANRVVYFRDDGFRHFIMKNGFVRPKKDQIRRFGLIKFINHVITSNHTYIYEKRVISKTTYIAIQLEVHSGYIIKIIVRESKNSMFHFVSIVDINKKSR